MADGIERVLSFDAVDSTPSAPDGGWCCAAMEAQVTHACGQCEPGTCPDQLVVYRPRFREYGMPVRDSPTPSSYVVIQWCPWCGTRLPESVRHEWFDELERRGLDPVDDEIPADMTTDEWLTR